MTSKEPRTSIQDTPTTSRTSRYANLNNPDTTSSSNNSSNTTPPWYVHFTNNNEEYNRYMREEWGFEEKYTTDRDMFEKLCLEGAQAGLSWRTILEKREAYRRTFHQFDLYRVSKMTNDDVESIINSSKTTKSPKKDNNVVVRHRGKIESVIHNAQCVLKLVETENTSFHHFLWSFVNHQPILNDQHDNVQNMPSQSPESVRMSRELKQRGFKFVGPTTCYSLMQSTGMVIDHPVNTPEWKAAVRRLEQRTRGFQRRSGEENSL